ncbi:cysteine hydrolase family protein [Falsibacillus pallidus]|uniref:Nicotinamidase-related amidase n=1 Tax=Falsibacillus pallidus TaxID=493781 RepID=A0A370GSW0_9BACI|nr:isochorismatase family cysteine hydrolase [Falsibacillus pallidus]RDI45614.1 nicotinamidase-related amidase [Falsibacillus pallidus]
MTSALLILDIQKDFVLPSGRFPIAEHQMLPIISRINEVSELFHLSNLPVIYIGNEFERKQIIGNFFRNGAALKGSQGAELDDRLTRVNDIYFSKKQGNALTNTMLTNYLRNNKAKHLFIMGVFAEGCIKATAFGSIKKGFHTTVIMDGVGGGTDQKVENSFRLMAKKGISLLKSHSIVNELSLRPVK